MSKKILKIYDPAMCCSTGVCGTDVDTTLVQIANFLTNLDKTKIEVHRYELSSSPQEYVNNETVKNLMATEGVGVLPITIIDDEVVFKGEYPAIPELSTKLGIAPLKLKF